MIAGFKNELALSKATCNSFRFLGGQAIQTHDSVTPGIPDIAWTIDGKTGWLELKLIPVTFQYPRVPTLARLGLTEQQLLFLTTWHCSGATVGLLVATDHFWFLVNGKGLSQVTAPAKMSWADWIDLSQTWEYFHIQNDSFLSTLLHKTAN